MPRPRVRAADLVAAALVGVGSLHFVLGDVVETALPRWIPAPRAAVYASGALEVISGIGLIRRRPWAGPLSAAVLLVIWTGNIQMALDAGTGRNAGIFDSPVLMWVRVPLQIPMIWVAWRAPRQMRT
ncbi:MAG: DoxX family protein [Acidimicrobiia bacterium]